MKNIKELLEQYEKNSDLLYRVEDYTHNASGYISDTISEIADSETDIYYSGLIDWLKNDGDAVENIEDALREFGTPENSGCPDFMRILQQGQYYGNEQKLYNEINTAGKIWLLAYLRDVENLTEITDEQAEKLDDLDVDSNDKWEDLLERFNENND